MARLLILLAVMLLPVVCMGCAADEQVGSDHPAALNQRYSYSEVKKRAERLERGMDMSQVLILLGSPAKRERGQWVYMQDRPGLLVPAETMRVYFYGRTFTEMKTKPVLLGEEF